MEYVQKTPRKIGLVQCNHHISINNKLCDDLMVMPSINNNDRCVLGVDQNLSGVNHGMKHIYCFY